MAAGYSKEFLIDAFVSRYTSLGAEKCSGLRLMAEKFYDEVGKDKFRVYASLDAAAIKEYKASVV
jgi:hypothetical protein